MAIERFTKTQFENALPVSKTTGEKLWQHVGFIDAEHVYSLAIDCKSQIMIRSSVKENEIAASSGKDSIRAWICDAVGRPIGSKIQSFIKRTHGWDRRLDKIMRELWNRRKIAGDCPICDAPMSIFKVKKEGKNKGRLFCKCSEHGKFRWLDEPIPADYHKKPEPKFQIPTEDEVKAIILNCPKIKHRVQALRDSIAASEGVAIWALQFVYDRQTEYEKNVLQTAELNKVGFNGVDAEILSSFCMQWEKRKSLSDKQMALVLKKMPKYSVQIEKILRGVL